MAPYPDIGVELTARALRRARRELADRYGRAHTDGVPIDLPLTHELISQLGGAQRPSVSTAIARLGERGLVDRTQTGWLLCGDPPTVTPPGEHGGPEARPRSEVGPAHTPGPVITNGSPAYGRIAEGRSRIVIWIPAAAPSMRAGSVE